MFVVANGVVSATAIGFLIWLIYFRLDESGAGGGSVLPAVNAFFNSVSAVLLVLGLRAIKAGKRLIHRRYMLAALASSALFLINYIYYHYSHGDTLFQGQGAIRIVYLCILASHIVLSIVVFPMILTSVYLAVTDRLAAHKRFSKWTWAGWMYVSVTGVLVFTMLHVIDW
jgi:putative membrane protein